jgi:hypothetical protein
MEPRLIGRGMDNREDIEEKFVTSVEQEPIFGSCENLFDVVSNDDLAIPCY